MLRATPGPGGLIAEFAGQLTQAEAWTVLARLWLVPLGQSVLHDLPARAGWQGALALLAWVGVGVAALFGLIPLAGLAGLLG